ncbi:hypothetical protein E4T25_11080 [Photobacterium damselae subsp. piscicida]|uniref:hypothetical protein n=1 Tax=Photobacterium damselae TaxID=38293 RepID=UPI00107617A7|nr:hypothetical protein [Photobacterium damselae]TFZ57841.1 hypothetical protein E4T25_11080 [Photobacterium damselae subsp. piscicida]
MNKVKWLYIGDNARLGIHDREIYIEGSVEELKEQLKEYDNIIDLINFRYIKSSDEKLTIINIDDYNDII